MEKKFVDQMLDCITDMQSNIDISAFKVEFINRYPGLTYSPAAYTLVYVFVDQYCTKELVATSHLINTDDLFDAAYRDFKNIYVENGTDDKLLELKKKAREIGYADKVFVSLVRTFQTIAKYIDIYLYGWTSEQIARTVLECMQWYYTDYWDSGESAEEYFLGCLMKTAGM